MIKKFKKSDTFNKEGEWQIDIKQLKEIINIMETKKLLIYMETLDDLIPVLHFLGYVEYEK